MTFIEDDRDVGRAIAVFVYVDDGVVLGGNDVGRGVFKQLVGAHGDGFDVLPYWQGVDLAGIARIDDVHRTCQNSTRC